VPPAAVFRMLEPWRHRWWARGDEAAVRRLADVRNEIRRHDTPWLPQLTVAQAAGELVAGWDDHPGVFWLATEGGEVVGWCHYHVSDFDNRHLAWCHVEVAPGHRRRGHGSRMLESLIEQARSEGRRTIGFQGWANALPLEFMQRHDTSVVGEHRGHRLGLLLKIAMLDHLRETEPQLAVIDTWNAATNDRMIAVNEALGYRVLGQALACQLRLAEVS